MHVYTHFVCLDEMDDLLLVLFPFTAYYRFVVLLFSCLQTFGCYFCYDIPSVLQDQFQGVRKSRQLPPGSIDQYLLIISHDSV